MLEALISAVAGGVVAALTAVLVVHLVRRDDRRHADELEARHAASRLSAATLPLLTRTENGSAVASHQRMQWLLDVGLARSAIARIDPPSAHELVRRTERLSDLLVRHEASVAAAASDELTVARQVHEAVDDLFALLLVWVSDDHRGRQRTGPARGPA